LQTVFIAHNFIITQPKISKAGYRLWLTQPFGKVYFSNIAILKIAKRIDYFMYGFSKTCVFISLLLLQ